MSAALTTGVTWRLRGETFLSPCAGSAIATVASAVGVYLVPSWHLSRSAFVFLALGAGLGLVLIRSIWLMRERQLRLPEFLGVGDPKFLAAVWAEVAAVIGVDAPLRIVSDMRMSSHRGEANVRCCSEEEALAVLNSFAPNVVVLSDGTIPSRQSAFILARASLSGSIMADILTFYETYASRAPIFRSAGGWIFRAQHRSPDYLTYLAKRLRDIAVTIALTPIAAPLIAVAATLVKLTSPGPAFFMQRRIGYRGREFSLVKLRSMYLDRDGQTQAWTRQEDPRITPFGRFLRSTAIDELPQLWNVLRGDISLVGPRPEQPEIVKRLSEEVPPYMQRHVVPCGMTGWAQIHRGSDVTTEDALDKIRLDLYYARNSSLWLDTVILLRTFQMILARAKPAPAMLLGRRTAATASWRATHAAPGRFGN